MDTRKLCVGFSSATRVARFLLGNLEVSFEDAASGKVPSFVLTEEMLRIVDLLLERWRREEHEATLLTMHNGLRGATLVEAAGAGGLRDIKFLLARGVNLRFRFSEVGSNALEISAKNGHTAVVAELLVAGAGDDDPYILLKAAECAAKAGHSDIMTMLHAHSVPAESSFPQEQQERWEERRGLHKELAEIKRIQAERRRRSGAV